MSAVAFRPERVRAARRRLAEESAQSIEQQKRGQILGRSRLHVLKQHTSQAEWEDLSAVRFWSAANMDAIIPDLIRLLADGREVRLRNMGPDFHIWPRVETGEQASQGHGYVVDDDLFRVAGRASWLLKEITGEDFGRVGVNPTPAELRELAARWERWSELAASHPAAGRK